MTKSISERESLLGVAINSKNTGVRGILTRLRVKINFFWFVTAHFLGQTSLPWRFVNMTLMSLSLTWMVLLLIVFLMVVRPNNSDKN